MSQEKANKLEIMRHSFSHVLATAVLDMFPDTKLGTGPATETGFYYDFQLPRTLIPEDLEILENKMKEIIKANYSFDRAVLSINEAREKFTELGQHYKVEIINDLEKEGEKKVTVYSCGPFVDLCAGPHTDSTGELPKDAFKLNKISGAYWRANENNTQMQRIYGLAFATKKELKAYLKNMEEAAKKDHRKLGKELDLFCFSDLVGPGLPLFTPKGTTIKEELQKEVERICRKQGFEKVMTPHLTKIDLYKISGHADKFGDELFHVTSGRKHEFVIKPVQCPHQTQIYASKQRSYRDLPIKYMESEKQYRAEQSGEVGGLSRVYAITVEDGHTFCTREQVKDEIIGLVEIVKDFYSSLGLWGNHWVSLSVRDYDHPEKYIGEKKDWDLCEQILQEVSDEMKLDAKKCEGEAALYGPKLDFMFKVSLDKEIQLATIQIDFATPQRFELKFKDKDGQEKNPVMVHRAILGSYERFMAVLIEHYAGAFPTWLSPVQVKIIPVSEKFADYSYEVLNELKEKEIRVEMSLETDTLGKRIRQAEKEKVPYMLIIGEKEVEAGTVTTRVRGEKKQETLSKEDFIQKILKEIEDKK